MTARRTAPEFFFVGPCQTIQKPAEKAFWLKKFSRIKPEGVPAARRAEKVSPALKISEPEGSIRI